MKTLNGRQSQECKQEILLDHHHDIKVNRCRLVLANCLFVVVDRVGLEERRDVVKLFYENESEMPSYFFLPMLLNG
jgi:hypothetical protein